MTMSSVHGITPLPSQASALLDEVEAARAELIKLTRTLVRIPSETPPGDTRKIAAAVAEILSGIADADVSFHHEESMVENVVAVVRSDRPGRRLILNGHLDTYPAGNAATWSDSPFSGILKDEKIHGRGSADMKGGVACLMTVFKLLAQNRDLWAGELVLTLAGDEESMGELGTQFLIDTVPEARGDAVLNADVGSPAVLRIGEKGLIWVDVFAAGKPAHGAHVHRGENAIDAMRAAMDALSGLSNFPVSAPPEVTRAVNAAKAVSEPLGGEGEADVLQNVTVNFGRISGGASSNLVADRAELGVDIRLPMGVTVAAVEAQIGRLLNPLENVRFEIVRRYAPSWTPPDNPIVQAAKSACRSVLGCEPVVNMRVGGSDARLYRSAGIPTVVCGLTPNNLGGPDEFVLVDELVDVTKIHLLSSLHFLQPT